MKVSSFNFNLKRSPRIDALTTSYGTRFLAFGIGLDSCLNEPLITKRQQQLLLLLLSSFAFRGNFRRLKVTITYFENIYSQIAMFIDKIRGN